MTLLASWVAVDPRGIQSMYMASDSRITWEKQESQLPYYDHFKKLYACKTRPEMFGFCGDVTFMSNIIEQLVNLIDAGVIFKVGYSPELKAKAILHFLEDNYNNYPRGILRLPMELLYCFRMKGGYKARFYCYRFICAKNGCWELRPVPLRQNRNDSNVSYFICETGSGQDKLKEEINEYIYRKKNGFSRGMFVAFCDALEKSTPKDAYGGPPQLIGLYRKPNSPAITFGVNYRKKNYYLGQDVDYNANNTLYNIEWRNDLFEIWDPILRKRKDGAQKQPRNA